MDLQEVGDQKFVKKPFNKKQYRFKKYSNKFRVQQWEEKNKIAAQRRYSKQFNKDEKKQKCNKNTDPVPDKEKKNGFYKAKCEFVKKQEEKQKKRAELERKQKEREEALKIYEEKKKKKCKILSQRTKRGQPLMRDRLKLLLEKIQDKN